jgi:lipopolysaccharide/colanic/teichoic acid biosynthesis glycosyltransferase
MVNYGEEVSRNEVAEDYPQPPELFLMKHVKHDFKDFGQSRQPGLLYEELKRVFDFALSLVALLFFSPFMLVIAILVKLTIGSAIYKHKRVGKNGKEFYLYKFRSMRDTSQPIEELLTKEQLEEYQLKFKVENDPRITKLGSVLRKTSLDELPQLLNIIKGEISIVGPRPVTQIETERYGVSRDLFLSVTPGLTGYWQVNGRSDTTYEQRMGMELQYISNRSFWLDMKIIFKTIPIVMTEKGAK